MKEIIIGKMKYAILLSLLFLVCSCKNENTKTALLDEKSIENTSTTDFNLEVYDFEGFKKFLNKKDDTVYVINFWATWCAPCVKELPAFEELLHKYKNENVEVILVSLDFPNQYNTKLIPFIEEHDLKSKIVALNDVDMDTWIPKVNVNWSGSIPATLIYKNNEQTFFEQSFTFETLENELKHFIK